MGDLQFSSINSKSVDKEKLNVTSNRLNATLNVYSGKSGEYWVSIVPSLNVSGYGDDYKSSLEDLEFNMQVLFEDLFKLSKDKRIEELVNLGWEKHSYFNKRFSKSFVDENGVLQNFDEPKEVIRSAFEMA